MGALIGFSFFHETLTLRKWAGVMLGLVGIGLITTTGEVDLSGQLAIGVLACLIATACYGCAGFLTRRWVTERGGLDAKLVAFGSQIGAVLFLLPFFGYTLATGPAVDWAQPGVWASVLAVGFLCTAFAYLLYFRLIADIGPREASLSPSSFRPSASCGLSGAGETLTGGFVFGGAVVCLAVWLVTSPARAVKSAKAQA